MTTLRTAALLLCVLMLAHAKPHEDVHEGHHGKQKRAASCVIDASLPCECTNPFLGTENFFLGDGKRNCKNAKACYVANKSGCSDATPARGGGRCQSKEACKPTDDKPKEGTTPKLTTPKPTTTEPTDDKPKEGTTPKLTTPKPTSPNPIGGDKICLCVNSSISNSCTKCEVDCMSDCNDLTKEGEKCFSELACQPALLFDE